MTQTDAEPVYRWNWYGTRKHIEHIWPTDQFGGVYNTLCHQNHEPRYEMLTRRRMTSEKLDLMLNRARFHLERIR